MKVIFKVGDKAVNELTGKVYVVTGVADDLLKLEGMDEFYKAVCFRTFDDAVEYRTKSLKKLNEYTKTEARIAKLEEFIERTGNWSPVGQAVLNAEIKRLKELLK